MLQHGYEVRFVPADVLIGELSHAAVPGTLEETSVPHLDPHVLVLDEVGYLARSADATNALYRVVNERYLRGRTIPVTTNEPLAAWGLVRAIDVVPQTPQARDTDYTSPRRNGESIHEPQNGVSTTS